MMNDDDLLGERRTMVRIDRELHWRAKVQAARERMEVTEWYERVLAEVLDDLEARAKA